MEPVTGDNGGTAVKVMRLRYAGTCEQCQTRLEAGSRAAYLRASKTVRCLPCVEMGRADEHSAATPAPQALPVGPDPSAAGTAGSSARREYERRSAKREARIRDAHPRLGGLILAMTDEPQSTTAWARGAKGEELLGRRLDDLAAEDVRLLHDRRIPGTRANIDHVAIGPTGVHVIDAKRYRGRPSLRVEGGLFSPRSEKLLVGSRDCTKLVEGVHKQVARVRAALDSAGLTDAPVHGSLCFVEADWPLLGGSFVVDDVAVLWPKKLAERLRATGGWTVAEIERVHATLAAAFPPA
ncbi:nuclease-related domain-containing protein [Cellulomonas sp.]|uniref:nuclease-related domain-containing protein n=1 Tax=Cellulomonas sp. TaxID=40001 RepID=UPI002588B334|nr:nuclease-related domain-containing protein [Cellulomonas sp.]MCR6688088.1 NERD domain-containing protein [Cellulomonas sp.]